jgi:hypothetical protein
MLLVIGVAVLIVADIVLATAGTVWQVVAGAAIWGLHMGTTQEFFRRSSRTPCQAICAPQPSCFMVSLRVGLCSPRVYWPAGSGLY